MEGADKVLPKKYEIFDGFLVTWNPKERTYTIYTKSGKFLSTVNDGELKSEINELKRTVNED